jgi:hypothetical protein
MHARLGDLFRCSDARCGFEVLVVHDTALPSSAACPTCCCGRSMAMVTP